MFFEAEIILLITYKTDSVTDSRESDAVKRLFSLGYFSSRVTPINVPTIMIAAI